MTLVLDIGNSNTVVGAYRDGTRVASFRLQSASGRMPDEFALLFDGLFSRHGIDASEIDSILMGSVVPQLTASMGEALGRLTGAEPRTVRHDMAMPVRIGIPNPAELGADLIANAVAAYTRCGGACVVVDFGTALTFTAVAADGTVRGASIAPGLRIASRALATGTAQLPEIEPGTPDRAIGTDTHSALQSALGFGYRGFVTEIVARMSEELGGDTTVYATGGLVEPIANHISVIDKIDQWLTLDGLQILADYESQ